MHISFDLRWLFGDGQREEIDRTLFRLLEAVRNEGSLTRAADSTSVSYRHAWGLVRKWEERLHAPLLHMQRGRGRGARLTDFSERLLEARAALDARFGPPLETAAAELAADLRRFGRARQARSVRIAASHGMGIAHLAELLREDTGQEVELHTHGSIESLRQLSRSECAAAGFHLPLGPLRPRVFPAYDRWLHGRGHALLLVATRQQGLMTPPSNPRRIHGLKDLTRRSVRFVNRQPGSGTRVIFDGLLDLEGLDRERIRGYRTEEFTETAVAATVAGGAADAGFGIAAAAAMFKLRFVRVLDEEYFVAVPEASELRGAIRRILRSEAFRQRLRSIPGYDAGRSGLEFRSEDLLVST